MEKSKSLSQSNSPQKCYRKLDQKVQFVETSDINFYDHKVYGKPPEAPRYSRGGASTSRLPNSNSTSNISSNNSSRSSSGGSSQINLDRSKSNSLTWASSLERKRNSSFNKHKTISEHVNKTLDPKRTQSLDRRQTTEWRKQQNVNNYELSLERKRRESENKDAQTKDRKPKSTSNNYRSLSGERFKLGNRLRMPPVVNLNQNDKDKTVLDNDSPQIENKPFCKTSKSGQWTCRIRAISRSPHRRMNKNEDGEDKENKRSLFSREHKSRSNENKLNDAKERGRSLKREHRSKHLSISRNLKIEETWVFEKDIMWSGAGNGKKGFLLFNCLTLDHPYGKDCAAAKHSMTFKFSQADSKLIRLLMESHGLKEVESGSNNFNVYWGNAHFNPNEIRQLQDWQKVNHFPRSSELTRKDRLYMNIKRMQRQFGMKLFDFIPTSFVLPTEYREFCDTQLRERGTWIVKPVASSQGKGIYLVTQVDQVPPDETSLVCRYIDSPLLVDGYKCDLRLYVAVSSLDPMVVYLYEEGLVRLATVKYQHGKHLWNPCIHLTNYSVNKFHSNYVQNEDPEVDDQGNKWSLSAFLRHLKSQGIDTGILMRSIEDVIIKSLLAASYQMNTATNMFVPHSRNCFELFGFDILIDNQLKPWVLEVNLSPSLNIDQPLDLKIKSAMLSDLFSLIGVPLCNPHTTKVSSRPSVYRKLPNLRYSTESYEKSFGRTGGNSVPIVPSAEELRILRQVKEEYERRGGWARIIPTPDSWAMYGALQEYDSPMNLILHHQLFPHVPRNNRFSRLTPLRMSSVSSSGLASSLERLTCYERALPKGIAYIKEKLTGKKSSNKNSDLPQVKESLIEALQNGLALSKYQARMAFSVYLQHIQRRLMIGCDQDKQTDLVLRFLRSATRTLHIPLNIQAPSKTLPGEARAVVISKQLGDFIQAYTKETHLYLDQSSSVSCSSLSSQCPTSVTTPSTSFVSSPISSVSSSENTGYVDTLTTCNNSTSPSTSKYYSVSNTSNFIVDTKPASLPCTSSSTTSIDTGVYSSVGSSLSSISSTTLYSSSGNSSFVSIGSPSQSRSSILGSSSSINSSGVSPQKSAIFSTQPIQSSAADNSLSNLPPRVRRLKSDGDRSIFSSDDKGRMAKSLDSADLESISSSSTADGANHFPDSQPIATSSEDGIAMDVYRAFLSSAKESDLEEVLSLQTRMHNSAGVFLDPARRSRSGHQSFHHPSGSNTSSSSISISSTPSSRPRTPTASPHGSPRKARRSPSHGSRSSLNETPITNEPQPQSDKISSPPTSAITSTTASLSQSSATSTSTTPVAANTSSCCLFGNILKASLKGTNTFITN